MKQNYRELIPNTLYIHLRDNSKKGFWHLHFRHNGKAYRESTKKADIIEATMAAMERYTAVKNNTVTTKPTTRTVSFAAVAERWLKLNETHRDIGNKRKAVEKFFIPFFRDEAKLKDVSQLRQGHLNDYLVWRRNYHVTGPGSTQSRTPYIRDGKRMAVRTQRFGVPKNATINRENQNLNQIIKFAVDEGHLPATNAPKMPMLKNDGERRPAFTTDQCQTLIRMARTRIFEATSDKMEAERRNLYDLVVLLRYTGLRPHEAVGLNWGHIDLDARHITIVKGKTGFRVMPIVFPELVKHLRAMKGERQTFAKFNSFAFGPSTPVFAGTTGERVQSFKNSFEALVQACGFVPPGEKPYSLYSFRHHVATHLAGLGVPDTMVVQILGTSRRMMDAHYDHTTADMVLKWFGTHGKPGPERTVAQSQPKNHDLDLEQDPQSKPLRLNGNLLSIE